MSVKVVAKLTQALIDRIGRTPTFVGYTLATDGQKYRRGWWCKFAGEKAIFLGQDEGQALSKIATMKDEKDE